MKITGLGANFYVSGFDLSGDTRELGNVSGGNSPIEVTAINQSAIERRAGRRDGRVEWTSYFNPTGAADAHAVLSAQPDANRIVTYTTGTALNDDAASMVAKQVTYDPTMGSDGDLTMSVQALANGFGLEWGNLVTAGPVQHTGATNGDGADYGVETDFGLQAYLHIVEFNGTDVTITLEESQNDGGGDAYTAVTGGAFTQATAVGSERIATINSQTVEQWLRPVTAGTFTTVTFAIIVRRNLEAGQVF